MQRAALRVGDLVAYTSSHPRSDYRYVDSQAMVIAFREGREGIGIARRWGKDKWMPMWVSGYNILMLWDDHLKQEEEKKAAAKKRRERKEAHKKMVDETSEKIKALGVKCSIEKYEHDRIFKVYISKSELDALIQRLEATSSDDQEWQ